LADFEQSMPNESKIGTDANPDFMVKKSEYKQEIEKLFEEGKMEEGIQKMD
jgi:hypothetical protein